MKTNWELIEAPHIKRSNAQNEHTLNNVNKAKGCAMWLAAQGFTVLSVIVGRRNPRIEIQASRRCASLDGAVHIYERTAAGAKRGWVAIRFDCEVRWSEGGAA